MHISFPYGKEVIDVEIEGNVYLVESRLPLMKNVNEESVLAALKKPIKMPPLREIIKKNDIVSILITDKTRATPNKVLIKYVLKALKESNVNKENIQIIIANGLHEPETHEEIVELVGKDIVEEYNIMNHIADDEESLVYLGKTSYGTELYINKAVVNSSKIIALGLIEPHFFAGYSGGRKLILPGVAGTKSVYQNHSFKMLSHPKADYGYLEGNPVHEDMIEAAKKVKLTYIVNVILDKKKNIIKAYAGDPFKAHELGVKELDSMVKVSVPFESDLTIVTNGGYPLDRNLYQAVKGMVTASRITRKDGVIIMLAECIDGIGHKAFYELSTISDDPRRILEYIKDHEPLRDQWEVQKLAQVLLKNKVIVVTRNISHDKLENMNLIPASNADEALELAKEYLSKDTRIIAIPEGPYVIPCLDYA